MMTKYNEEISRELLCNKMDDLVNQFYKILPLKENGSPTVQQYMEGFMRELLGLKSLINALESDGMYLAILGVLQYHIDNECDTAKVKSDVFKAIQIIKKLKKKIESTEE